MDKKAMDRVRAQRRGHRSVTTRLIQESKAIMEDLKNEANDIEHEIEEADDVLLRILDTILDIEMTIKKYDTNAGDLSQNVQAQPDQGNSNLQDVNDNDSDSTTSATEVQIPSTSAISSASAVNVQTSTTLTNQQTSSQTTHIQDTPTIHNQVRPKLPKISLPRFNGDVTKFQTFWDSFDSAINKNQHMAAIDKFNYLKGLLDGQASRAIQGLTLSEANYEAALQLIHDRFGKTQKIISTHMDNLLKLPFCNDSNYKASHLRNVYDIVSVNIRGLESLGVRAAQYGSFLIPILMEKMPSDVQLQIARVSSKDVWELDELLEVIKTEVEARELCETVRVKPKTDFQATVKQLKKPTPTASSLVVRENTSFRIVCVYCSGDHYSSSCQEITDIKARRDILKQSDRCFLCLRTGHTVSKCDSQKTCRKCNGRHQQSICEGIKSKYQPSTATHVTTTTTVASSSQNTKILLQTANAYAISQKDSMTVPVRLLFDGCSQKSYVTTETQRKLGLRSVKNEKLNINTFGKESYIPTTCDLVDIRLQNKHGDEFKIQARTFSSICSPISVHFDVKQYPHLQHLDLADDQAEQDISQRTDILIGADYYWLLVTGETIREPNGPTAVESVFGWLISGPVNSSSDNGVISNLIISDSADSLITDESSIELIDNLKTFWDTEAIGISDTPTPSTGILSFLKDIHFDTNLQRYEVRLPWNNICLPGSNNYDLCQSRLHHLYSRLQKNISHLHQYDDIIQEQLVNGIIEKVPAQEVSEVETCFLPHHGVIREDKDTTKLRIVFDGSAKSESAPISLNNCLDKGPNLTPLIFNVLTNFRSKPIGLIADIEKAFHQITIHPNDRDMLRFLWFNSLDAAHPEIIQYRFQRLVFGLISSPAILNCVIKHHLEKVEYQNSEFIKQLSDSLYVDDFSGGACSTEEGFELYKQSKQIFKDGGFNLRKWNSNSSILRDQINACENPSNPESSSTSQTESKILGLSWDIIQDEFRFDVSEVLDYIKTLQPTKRSILKVSAKIFDPLGLLSPFSVKMKIIFQELCESKVNWDDNLSSTHQTLWNQLENEFIIISKIRIPRCLYPTESKPIFSELHGFSDASEKAYAAVIYFRTVFDNGDVNVRLIAAKTRVAPKKKQTIPRLELLGALILARLMYTIQSAINNNLGPLQKAYWTDSFTTLCWIKNAKPWKQYIQHRVDEIRSISEKSSWRFCPGVHNPSDIPSRSCSAFDLLNNNEWWTGPIFLRQPTDQWPDLPTNYDTADSNDELQKHPKAVTHALVTVDTSNISTLLDVNRYNSLTKLLRVTALVLKFPRLLRQQQISKSISSDDITEAQNLWVKQIQSTVFSEELSSLQNNSKPTTYMKQFGLFLDDNHILRCQGRIGNSILPEFSKHPIFLPAHHPFTRLIIQRHHQGVHHNGIRETLNSIREQYWIIRGRESVKKFIRRCVICKKFDGRPYSTPPVPDLPIDRVSIEPPFTNTGLDFAGPLFVKSTTDPKSTFKTYICLFTCSSTRAVHFELTTDLTTNSFLQAFRRFASRRGLPTRLLSDNAKTFKASANDVIKIIRSEEISDYLINKQVSWENIVEKAPWWGGFWERLVRSLKRCLKKTIGRSSLTFEELRTIITEIETTLNRRR